MMHFLFGTLKDLISNKLSTDRCWLLHVSLDGFWSNTSKVVSEHVYKWDPLCCSDKRHMLCWCCVVWMDLHVLSWLPRNAFCRNKAGSSQSSRRTGGPGWDTGSVGALCLALPETQGNEMCCSLAWAHQIQNFTCELWRWGMQVPLELVLEDVAVHHPSLCVVPCSGHWLVWLPPQRNHSLCELSHPKSQHYSLVAKLLSHPWDTWPWVAWSMPPEVWVNIFFLVLFKSGPFK